MSIYTAKYSQDKKFYVYQYLRSCKSKHGDIGTPYYIGKGSSKRLRCLSHCVSVPIDKKQTQIILGNMNEADAFQLEMLLIHLYGRIDLGVGILRNKTFGGDGASGIIWTAGAIAKCKATKERNNTMNVSVKAQATIKRLGLQAQMTAKVVETRKNNGSYVQTEDAISKMVAKRKATGSYVRSLESLQKEKDTKIKRGIIRDPATIQPKARKGEYLRTPETAEKQRQTRMRNKSNQNMFPSSSSSIQAQAKIPASL
jgi:hypothetical protein